MDNTIKSLLLTPMNMLYRIDPELELKLLYRLKMGRHLNLKNPVTYNEKIQWIKLFYKNDLMPICADKYTVREYVEKCGCGDILNELLWQGFDAKDIPFEKLPNKFVIKVTHGSGYNIICKDKARLDTGKVVKKINSWLKQKYIPCYGEWFYGVVKPRVIVEKFLDDSKNQVPMDYKFFCFNNIEGNHGVGVIVVDTDRFINHKRKVYDVNWNELSNVMITFPYDHETNIEKPGKLEQMIEYAKKLSEPFPHARIDFYYINDKIFFGEITFTNGAGFSKILPYSFNEKMGSWIRLADRVE
ncbi:MAG: glycosyltransferase [Clostridiales bacterium]|nr:glycosyltransferase [Clostridiales bacterium]